MNVNGKTYTRAPQRQDLTANLCLNRVSTVSQQINISINGNKKKDLHKCKRAQLDSPGPGTHVGLKKKKTYHNAPAPIS